MNAHFSSGVEPGTRLVAAIAPGFTIGFVRPSSLRSTAARALNGRPVALTPSLWRATSAPRTWQISANTNGFDTLMIENGTSQSPLAWTAPFTPTTQRPNRSGGAAARAG